MGAACSNANLEAENKLEGAGEAPAATVPQEDLKEPTPAETPAEEVKVEDAPKEVADADAPKAETKVTEEAATVQKVEEESSTKTEDMTPAAEVDTAKAKGQEETEPVEEANIDGQTQADEEAKDSKDKILKEAKEAEHAKTKEKAEAPKKKRSGENKKRPTDEAKKKSKEKDDAAKKKKEEADAAAKKKAEEDQAAQKKEAESAKEGTSKEEIKARDAAWKKVPPAEAKAQAKELLEAAKAGNALKVTQMITGGVSANAIDGDGWTALMKAAEVGKTDMMELLWEYGADSSMTVKLGEWGNNALHHAARNNHVEAVKLLLARGKKSEFTAKNFQGKTPRDYTTDDAIKSLIKKACK